MVQVNSWEILCELNKVQDIGSGASKLVKWRASVDLRGLVKGLYEHEPNKNLNQEDELSTWIATKAEIYEKFFNTSSSHISQFFQIVPKERKGIEYIVPIPLNNDPAYCFGQGSIYISPANPDLSKREIEYIVRSALLEASYDAIKIYEDRYKTKVSKEIFVTLIK
ncbi:MAG: hypothetical protein QXZ20_01685 [Candidatus Aenigmatarchaeota archaeon]